MPYIITYPNNPRFKGVDHYYMAGNTELTSDMNQASRFTSSEQAQSTLDNLDEVTGYLPPVISFVSERADSVERTELGRESGRVVPCPHCGKPIQIRVSKV